MTHAELIAYYCELFDISTVVETGTGYGFTTKALAEYEHIKKIFSVEIVTQRFLEATEIVAGNAKITLINDDSAKFVKAVADVLPRCVWFLDAHNSEPNVKEAESPLLDEVRAIAKRGGDDVILVDDVRLLGQHGWPTLEEVIEAAGDRFEAEVIDDVLRLT